MLQSQGVLPSGEGHDSFLIAYIRSTSNDRELHLVKRPLKELLVVFHEEPLDILELSLSLGNGVNVDAFHKHLNERGALWKLRPC